MISSQLQAQLFSKDLTWEILIESNPHKIWRRTAPQELTIKVYTMCVYVHLPKSEFNQGISTFISFWDYIEKFQLKSACKSDRIVAMQVRKNIFTVTSSQGQDANLHTVSLNLWGASCTCMLYKCLHNRVIKELPYYGKLLKQSRYFSGQVVCHHIDAALGQKGFFTLQDYLESNKQIK